jgi:hypothetical protein
VLPARQAQASVEGIMSKRRRKRGLGMASSPSAARGRARLLAAQAASKGHCSIAKDHLRKLHGAPVSEAPLNREAVLYVKDHCGGGLSGHRPRRRRK